MKNIFKTILAVLVLGGVLTILPSYAYYQFQDQPTIKKLGTYRGDTFPGFTELRVQQVEFDQLGVMSFVSNEPYDFLVNVNYITSVHRFEDAKNTDYSCLMYFSYAEKPILVRMTYKEVYSAIRKAAEAQVK